MCAHRDEVEANGVISLHGDRPNVLRDHLKTLQGFVVTSRQQLRTGTKTKNTQRKISLIYLNLSRDQIKTYFVNCSLIIFTC